MKLLSSPLVRSIQSVSESAARRRYGLALFALSAAAASAAWSVEPEQPGEQTTDSKKESASRSNRKLDEVIVIGANEHSGASSTKVDVPLMELPVSQQTVTRALIEQRGLQHIDEAVDTVAGVRRVSGYPGATGYIIRGFFEGYDLLRDGFRDINYGASDFIGIDRIDVLKGPASVLYSGNLSAGGVINLVSRKPQSASSVEVDVAGGSYGYWRASADATGALNSGETATFRVGAATEDSGDFRDSIYSRQWTVAPSLQWRLTDLDTLLVQAEYIKTDFNFPADFPMSKASLHIPIKRYLLEPGIGGSSSDNRHLTVDYQHEFSSEWKIRLAGNTARFNVDIGNDRLYYPFLNDDGRTMPRPVSAGPQSTQNDEVQAEIYGTFATGTLDHNIVTGINGFKQFYKTTNYVSDLSPIDIFDPVYGKDDLTFNYQSQYESEVKARGIFLQDLVSVGQHIKLLGALRRDRMESSVDYPPNGGGSKTTDHATTYRAGVVYLPVADTSLYASTSSSFVPNIFSQAADGSILKPTTGKQWEVGVKQQLLDQRLSASLALFEIKRRDIPTADIDNPGFAVSRGEQRSRGLEAQLDGRLTEALAVNASYAYTDATVTHDESLPVGDHLAGVPKHAISLWSTYTFSADVLRGFGLGLGAYYASSVEATLPNTFTLDAYTRWDALAFYDFPDRQSRLSVNIKNLSNVKYYDTDGGYTLRPNAPRTVIASFRHRF